MDIKWMGRLKRTCFSDRTRVLDDNNLSFYPSSLTLIFPRMSSKRTAFKRPEIIGTSRYLKGKDPSVKVELYLARAQSTLINIKRVRNSLSKFF